MRTDQIWVEEEDVLVRLVVFLLLLPGCSRMAIQRVSIGASQIDRLILCDLRHGESLSWGRCGEELWTARARVDVMQSSARTREMVLEVSCPSLSQTTPLQDARLAPLSAYSTWQDDVPILPTPCSQVAGVC